MHAQRMAEESASLELGSASRDYHHHKLPPRPHAPEWNDLLHQWQRNKEESKERRKPGVTARAIVFYVFFTFLACGTAWLCYVVGPQHFPSPHVTFTDALVNMFSLRVSGLYSFAICMAVVAEIGLFLLATCLVRWPSKHVDNGANVPSFSSSSPSSSLSSSPPGAATHAANPRADITRHVGGNPNNRSNATVEVEDVQRGLIPDVALMIACHCSTSTPDAQATFERTLRSALRVFKPGAIFVCDNGNGKKPADDTEEVVRRIHPEIHYLFIPEGNKTHAMYWCTEYWIPELHRQGRCADFPYAMMIDDDVPLPPDLTAPLRTLKYSPDVAAVSYMITAATEDGSRNLLVELQDLEYKLAGTMKMMQARFGSAMYCHGAIGLWRREILGRRILFDHDTVFHGEDLYMGLLLHRMHANQRIITSASSVVPTFAPENLLILFRQRVKSWDLCAQRKFLSYLKELFFNWTRTTLVLKPFFFYEATSIVVDWTRPIMVAVLAHTNPVALLACFIFFYLILWLELVLFNYVILRRRADLRVPLRACLLFPFYKTMLQVFRTCALLENAMRYTTWTRKNVPIGTRERARCDLPPVPPHAHPPWADVWVPSTVEYGTQSGSSVGVGGGGGGAMPFRVVSNRELWGAGDNGVPPPHHHPHHLDAAMATTAGDGSECKSGDELSWGANSSATHQPPASGGDLAAPPAVQPTRPYTTLLRAYCNSICASSICEIPDAQHRGRFTFILEGYLLSAKLFEEDAALSFPRALATKQHDGAAESMMIRNLRDRIVHSLQSVLRQVADARCRAIMDAINGHLGDWNRRGRGLAVILSRPGVPPRAPANDAELCAVAVANMEALKEVGLALSLAKYPAHHDPLEQARRSVDELRALLGSVFEPYFARIAQQPRPSAPPM